MYYPGQEDTHPTTVPIILITRTLSKYINVYVMYASICNVYYNLYVRMHVTLDECKPYICIDKLLMYDRYI